MDMEKLDPSPSYPLNKSQWEIGNEDGRRRKEVYRAEGRKKGKEGEEGKGREGKGGRNKGGKREKGKGKREREREPSSLGSGRGRPIFSSKADIISIRLNGCWKLTRLPS